MRILRRPSDRIFGALGLLLGLAYVRGALEIPTPFAVDPLGPRTFPVIVGTTLALAGLWPLLRPDPEPDWPSASRLAEIVFAVTVFLAYVQLLEPLGYPLATALAAGLLGWRLGARPLESVLLGLATGFGLWAIFAPGLGLSLPTGILGR